MLRKDEPAAEPASSGEDDSVSDEDRNVAATDNRDCAGSQHDATQRKRRRDMSPNSLRDFWKQKKAEKKQRKKERAAQRQEEQRLHWDNLSEAERAEVRSKALLVHNFRRNQEEAVEKRCAASLSDLVTPVIVFDLSFADLMDAGGIKSTLSQVKFSFSLLRRHGFPFRPVITSATGPFESLGSFEGFKRYPPLMTRDHWEGVLLLREAKEGAEGAIPGDTATSTASSASACSAFSFAAQPFRKESVVYLTADSDSVLMDLEPGTAYIVGTFVDHNSKKGATLELARRVGVRTARLPIEEFMKVGNLCKVLTVNTVVDVLCRFAETKNWTTAFEALPTRRV